MTRIIIYFIFLILQISCASDNQEEEFGNIVYEINGEEKRHNIEGQIYDNGIIIIDGHIIKMRIESQKEESFTLGSNSFSRASYYPINAEKEYSANLFEDDQGYISITNFDEENLSLSGNFAYEAKYLFDLNSKVNIENGRFKNLPLTIINGLPGDGYAHGNINGNEIKFTNVKVSDRDTYIHVFIQHPNRNAVSIQIPKDLELGEYQITESDNSNKDEVVVWYEYESFGTPIIHIPADNCIIRIDEANFDDNYLKGQISGSYSNNIGDESEIQYLNFILNWND
jgi:hypothetical protein